MLFCYTQISLQFVKTSWFKFTVSCENYTKYGTDQTNNSYFLIILWWIMDIYKIDCVPLLIHHSASEEVKWRTDWNLSGYESSPLLTLCFGITYFSFVLIYLTRVITLCIDFSNICNGIKQQDINCWTISHFMLFQH